LRLVEYCVEKESWSAAQRRLFSQTSQKLDMSETANYTKSILPSSIFSRPDSELDNRVKKTSERICENLHIVANEPSLAFYRIAEHVRKALPPTVESRAEVKKLNRQLQGAYYDAEYGLQTVKALEGATPHLTGIQELLKNAIFLQQQLKYEQSRTKTRGSGPSIYQRFSAHLTSVDLPDLQDLRETAERRVETAIGSREPAREGALSQGKEGQQQGKEGRRDEEQAK